MTVTDRSPDSASARLPLHDPVYTDPRSLGFLAALILVQRPLAVAIATWGLDLTAQERVFLAFLAPRGIVAAAVGSIFAIELADAGYPGAERLAPVVFLIIIGTAEHGGRGYPDDGRRDGRSPTHDALIHTGCENEVEHQDREDGTDRIRDDALPLDDVGQTARRVNLSQQRNDNRGSGHD